MKAKTKWHVLWVLVAAWCFDAQATVHTMTHQDLWLMPRVGAPVVSPDGTKVVVAVMDPAYDGKEQSHAIWLTMTDGAQAPRKIVTLKSAPGPMAWGPKGRRLAFVAKRDGDDASQIYVLDLAQGGEAQRITSLSTGAGTPLWSPDGTKLLFVSDVYPGAMDDAANKKAEKAVKDRKYNARVYESFPIRYWDKWLGEKVSHLFVQEAKAGAVAHDLLAPSKLAAQPGFSGTSGGGMTAVWTPDGQGVVFSATTRRNQAAFADVTMQLFLVDLNGGEPVALTAGNESYGNMAFTADGKQLLATMDPSGDQVYYHTRLAAFPWPFDAAKRTVLTKDADLSVGRFVVSTDSATVYFTAEAPGLEKLYSVPVAGGAVKAYSIPETGCLTNLTLGGTTLLANYDSAVSPVEVVKIDAEKSTLTTITHFTQTRTAALDLSKPEHFTFTSAKGREIHSLLIRPPGFDAAKKYPLLVLAHGGPHLQWRDQWVLRWNYHLLAAPGYVVLLTNYTGSTGSTEAFAQAIKGDPLRTPGDEINEAADEAIKRYAFVDGSRQLMGGASYGGHLANWFEATTTRYKAIVSHAGLSNLRTQWSTSDSIYNREVMNLGPVWEQGPVWSEQSPVTYAANHFNKTGWVTPILLTVGENDFRVPMNNTLETWSYVQRLQIPGKLIVFPEENHHVLRGENSRFWYAEVQAWLAKWVN